MAHAQQQNFFNSVKNKFPVCIMLIGLPCSGKSYFNQHTLYEMFPQLSQNNTVFVSTDIYIEQYATQNNKTYNEVFQEQIKPATKNMYNMIEDAVKHNKNISWDQTNTSVKTRSFKLKAVPDTYEKIAVMFMTPEDKEHARRLASRPGKHIPDEVMANMKAQLEIPTEKEGFDNIIFVDNK